MVKSTLLVMGERRDLLRVPFCDMFDFSKVYLLQDV